MSNMLFILLLCISAGLVSLGLLLLAHRRGVILAIRLIGLALVNGIALLALLALFGVSRLEGSTPPGLAEFLQPFWLPLIGIVLIDLALIFMKRGSVRPSRAR